MRKLALGLSTAALMVGFAAAPALADVYVFGFIDKDVDVMVDEDIDIDKLIDVDVFMGTIDTSGEVPVPVQLELNGAAEASAYVNQRNNNNENNSNIEGFTFQPDPNNPNATHPIYVNFRTAEIGGTGDGGSILDNSGIVGVNQDAGNMNNQANVVAFAFTGVSGSITNSQAGTDQRNQDNDVVVREAFPPGGNTDNPFALPNSTFQVRSTIEDSINMNIGIVGVNQSSGLMNNQSNSVAVAAGVNPAFALGESGIGQVTSGNTLSALNSFKKDEILNSINDNVGAVVQVNQTAGFFNNQNSSLSISAGIATSEITGQLP